EQLQEVLAQLGATQYHAQDIQISGGPVPFIPGSRLKALRRDLVEQLNQARIAAFPHGARKPVAVPPPVYPQSHLSFLANVYNHKARAFYQRYGVKLIDAAYEAHEETGDVPVMVTKHCLRFAFNLCPKQIRGELGLKGNAKPMQLLHGDEPITLKFDCKPCEMHVMGKIKPHIFNSPQPGSMASSVGYYDPSKIIASSNS